MLVEKEYVKGRKNVYSNPAIDQYNKTSSAANNTVGMLVNIIKNLRPEDKQTTESKKSINKLMDALMG